MKKILKGIKKGFNFVKENLFECIMITGLTTILGMVLYFYIMVGILYF